MADIVNKLAAVFRPERLKRSRGGSIDITKYISHFLREGYEISVGKTLNCR